MTNMPDRSTWREHLIGALVPPTYTPTTSSAPLALLPASPPPAISSPALAVARPDNSGRIIAHALTRALDWQPRDLLIIDLRRGAIVVARDPVGRHRLGPRGEIPIPKALRTLAHIGPGQQLLLAALPDLGLLVAHQLPAVTKLLTRLHTPISAGMR
jgi:bifunctional DNA-binding transcriptional regulator/antitoxin component of YhaV-PrlF toxin-antitoxin module